MRMSILLAAVLAVCACGGDDGGTAADRLGVGAECSGDQDCLREGDGGINLACLQFKGGYCGVQGCKSNADCPNPSVCVAHSDGKNYCFRTCGDKPECNQNRSPDLEANCASNVDYVDPGTKTKACVPPSGT